ncbi:hypothetical protein M407DRAFT_196197 [Tulasnella calospora MUT 4182]|uniref:Uncharacterized protein n=1 Tax=Tulasnella calospora MUT 4182 TaxID=1051891 RepID=A0A0C3QKH2_9AGAM|nr:hypothetical protein M407DRAFT_196197 [Tulasnella calospora MUT 4182]
MLCPSTGNDVSRRALTDDLLFGGTGILEKVSGWFGGIRIQKEISLTPPQPCRRRCLQLNTNAMMLVFAICDHYDHERVDTMNLQPAIARTVRVIKEINIDVEEWAALPFWQSVRRLHMLRVPQQLL